MTHRGSFGRCGRTSAASRRMADVSSAMPTLPTFPPPSRQNPWARMTGPKGTTSPFPPGRRLRPSSRSTPPGRRPFCPRRAWSAQCDRTTGRRAILARVIRRSWRNGEDRGSQTDVPNRSPRDRRDAVRGNSAQVEAARRSPRADPAARASCGFALGMRPVRRPVPRDIGRSEDRPAGRPGRRRTDRRLCKRHRPHPDAQLSDPADESTHRRTKLRNPKDAGGGTAGRDDAADRGGQDAGASSSSTRRFFARPSGVALEATGSAAP